MRGSFRAYGISFGALAAAVGLRWLLDPMIGDTLPLVTLFGAVARRYGWVVYLPAIAVAILGYVTCAWLFIEPRGEITYDAPTMVGLVAYSFTCSLIIGIGETMRRAQVRAGERGELLRVTLGSIGDAVITTDDEGRVGVSQRCRRVALRLEASGGVGPAARRSLPHRRRADRASRSRASRPGRCAREWSWGSRTTPCSSRGRRRAPIDDSAAPIRDEQGRISGCVLIFRDVSLRRRWSRGTRPRASSMRGGSHRSSSRRTTPSSASRSTASSRPGTRGPSDSSVHGGAGGWPPHLARHSSRAPDGRGRHPREPPGRPSGRPLRDRAAAKRRSARCRFR